MKVPARILTAVGFVVLASLFYLTAGSARTGSINPQTVPTNLNGSFSTGNPDKEIGRPLPPVLETPVPPSAGYAGITGYPPPIGYPPAATPSPNPGLRILMPLVMKN